MGPIKGVQGREELPEDGSKVRRNLLSEEKPL